MTSHPWTMTHHRRSRKSDKFVSRVRIIASLDRRDDDNDVLCVVGLLQFIIVSVAYSVAYLGI